MPLLIDTYNVLHMVGVLPPELAGIDVQGLMDLLRKSRYRDEIATLVCDGAPQPKKGERPISRSGTMTVRYSGHGKPADDLIAQLIRASTAPRRLVVVSSDHAVLRSASRRRCKTMTSEEFLQQLVNDALAGEANSAIVKKPASAITQQQVDRWIDVFKLDPETVAIESGAGHLARSPSSDKESAPSEAEKSPAASSAAGADQVPELPPGPVLPPEVIEQAERIWKHKQVE